MTFLQSLNSISHLIPSLFPLRISPPPFQCLDLHIFLLELQVFLLDHLICNLLSFDINDTHGQPAFLKHSFYHTHMFKFLTAYRLERENPHLSSKVFHNLISLSISKLISYYFPTLLASKSGLHKISMIRERISCFQSEVGC